MHFSDILERLPRQARQQLAQNWHIKLGMNDNQLKENLLEFVYQKNGFATRFQQLDHEERQVLAELYYGSDQEQLLADPCHQHLQEMLQRRSPARDQKSRPQPNLNGKNYMKSHFLDRGLAFEMEMDWYSRKCYLIPEEVGLHLGVHLIQESVPYHREGVDKTAGEDWNFLVDLHALLACAATREIRLTQKGIIFRKAQKEILEHFAVQEDTTSTGSFHDYPERFSVLIQVAEGLKLAINDRDRGLFTVNTGNEFFRLAPAQQWQQATFYVANAAIARSLMSYKLLGLLRVAGPETWLDTEAMLAALARVAWNPANKRYEAILQEFLWILFTLGWTLRGQKGGREAVRLSPMALAALVSRQEVSLDPAPVTEFYLQPNYEILAPIHLHPAVRWRLELLADLKKADKMLVYVLTRASLRRALEGAMQAEEVMAFLEKHSKNPVPDNVRFTIEDWARDYGQLYLQRAALLRCRDEVVAARVKGSPRLAPFILGEITPLDLLVKGSEWVRLLQSLDREGLSPKRGVVNLDQDEKEQQPIPGMPPLP